ncbi:MAG: hypothetical protein AAB362_00180 [Patescibacteria group bacterium]
MPVASEEFVLSQLLWMVNKEGVVSKERGFLPKKDPQKLFCYPREHGELYRRYDEVTQNIPTMLYAGTLRAHLEKLPPLPIEDIGFLENARDAKLAFRYLSFLVSAYAWADCVRDIDAPHAKTIPANLAVPFSALAKKLCVQPILAYWSYALSNFAVIDKEKPIEFSNLRLLQHFTVPPYDHDESGFILPHVEIEAEAGLGLCAIVTAKNAVFHRDISMFVSALSEISASLRTMSETFRTIPSVCSPDHYYLHVRPWIFYFKDITYEGVGHFDILKGETGAESAAIMSFDRALGVSHTETELTKHLEQLKMYRTPEQRAWLRAIEESSSIREFAILHKDDARVKDAFNDAHSALGEFRREHINAAIVYIKHKGRGDIATGGTHYERFLGKLIEETKASML